MPLNTTNEERVITKQWDVKELREWGTFILSFIAVPTIAIAGMWLKGQRMELEREIARSYVSKEVYAADRSSQDNADKSIWLKIGETNSKLDEIRLQSATTLQIVTDLKDEVKLHKTQ